MEYDSDLGDTMFVFSERQLPSVAHDLIQSSGAKKLNWRKSEKDFGGAYTPV
jgi:hypothetical protein